MRNKWIIPVLCLLFLVYVVLKKTRSVSQSTTEVSDHAVVVEIPEDFPPFYDRFHTDSLYQMDHIIWPLSERSDGSKWTQEDWVMHKPFDNSSGEFTRDIDNFQGIITERIQHTQGMFSMKRTFSKMGDEWTMITYVVNDSFAAGADGEWEVEQ